MRHSFMFQGIALAVALSPALLFWRRSGEDERREAVFTATYDITADLYASAASLKPEWAATWENRETIVLPPKFDTETFLPDRTVLAAREIRFARNLLQRHRWRSTRQPLFDVIEPGAWATLQRALQVTPVRLLALEDEHAGMIRGDEVDWIARAVEGYDNARAYIRSAEREDEPLERQVANATYVAVHLSLQLSDRFIERQRFELLKDV